MIYIIKDQLPQIFGKNISVTRILLAEDMTSLAYIYKYSSTPLCTIEFINHVNTPGSKRFINYNQAIRYFEEWMDLKGYVWLPDKLNNFL